MECDVCRNGETKSGRATVTLEREGMTLVVRGVPAEVCSNCGEEYIDEAESARLIEFAETSIRDGVKVAVRDYLAA